MSPLSTSRRRAEAFDTALRAGAAGASGADAPTRELLALVASLGAVQAPPARAEFVADLREQLVLAAQTELSASTATDPRTGRLAPPALPRVRPARERRLAAALAGFALAGASATMAVAAQSSLPGDTLYPLKRAIEEADTTLRADGDEGRRLLQHAAGRLVELQALSEPGRDAVRTPVLTDTLATFEEQADDASVALLEEYAETGDQRSVVELHDFAAESLASLGALEPTLPAAVRPELLEAAQTLLRIDAAADQACPECAGGGAVSLPGTLVSATVLDPAPTDPAADPEAAVPSVAPQPAGSEPSRTPSRVPSPQAETDPTPTARPPADRPTPSAAPDPPPQDAVPVPPAIKKPPSPAPTRDGLVGGLLEPLIGGGQTPSGNPSPTPLLPGVGDLLGDTLGGLGGTADKLLP